MGSSENDKYLQKWDRIKALLSSEIESISDLIAVIHSLNPYHATRQGWSFAGLKSLIKNFNPIQSDKFFKETLPFIIKLVLKTDCILPEPIPLQKQQSKSTLTLTQLQCACILANSFLSNWPKRNSGSRTKSNEYENYPFINFNYMMSSDIPSNLAKIKCLLNYFERVKERHEIGFDWGNVTFERRSVLDSDIPDWLKSKQKIDIDINFEDVPIESCSSSLQADFANKFIGGGVL